MPLFPAYEWVNLPDDRMHVVKAYLECNYLQGIEGDFDSSHTTFLHCNNLADLARLNRDGAPTLEAEESDYGMSDLYKTIGAGQKLRSDQPLYHAGIQHRSRSRHR